MTAPLWIIQTSFVGDCVLSLPFLFELGRITDAPLVIVTQNGIQKQLFEVALERGLKHLAARTRIITLAKKSSEKSFWGLRRWTRALVAEGGIPEKVFCLQRSFRSGLVAVLSGANDRVGFSSGAASFFYTRLVRRGWEQGEHEIEKNLDLLRAAYPSAEILAWRGLDKPSLLAADTASRPERHTDRAAIALGSPWPTKRWPVEHAIDLCRKWAGEGIEVLLIGDPSARSIAEEIRTAVPSLMIQDHVGKTSMSQWVDLLDSCAVLVSGDSASVHVASDIALPVVALFGPTVPEFGFTPWRSHSKVLQHADLACRPCSIHGPKQCPLGHHQCLKNIGAERVFAVTKPYLLMDPSGKRL
ncbi:MAG: glycosyltransferase family 9 protein [Bdellovibrionota bacterium]